LLLAYLRGWITLDTQKQGIRSQLRQEVVLSALASELDADCLKNQALAYASTLPAFNFGVDQATSVIHTIVEDLSSSGRLREYGRITEASSTARRAPTIDGMFKLYQALLDTKIVPKAT